MANLVVGGPVSLATSMGDTEHGDEKVIQAWDAVEGLTLRDRSNPRKIEGQPTEFSYKDMPLFPTVLRRDHMIKTFFELISKHEGDFDMDVVSVAMGTGKYNELPVPLRRTTESSPPGAAQTPETLPGACGPASVRLSAYT